MLDDGNGIWSVFFVLIVLILVLVLAYFATRWLGKRAGSGQGKGNIEILDRQYVGQDKCLLIVRVGNHSMLLGVTSGQIRKISDIDESELKLGRVGAGSEFSSVIRKTMENKFPVVGRFFPGRSDGNPEERGDDHRGGPDA